MADLRSEVGHDRLEHQPSVELGDAGYRKIGVLPEQAGWLVSDKRI